MGFKCLHIITQLKDLEHGVGLKRRRISMTSFPDLFFFRVMILLQGAAD